MRIIKAMTFKENLLECMNESKADSLINSLNLEDTHAVLLNTRFISDEEFISLYPKVKPHPLVKHAFIYDKNEYQLGKSLLHELGYFYIQDPAAMVVSNLLDYNPDDIILDMCAAPGGKSIQAAFKSNKDTIIIANDISFSRASLISNNVERLGLDNIIISNNDFSKNYRDYINTFDNILDAPCSGSGMFRKDEQMMLDWSINKVYKFAEIQKQLILIAYNMLKPGGILSYSTCSYSIQEDEEVIEYLLNHSDAKLIDLVNIGYKNPNKPIGIRLTPDNYIGEGQYICQISKPGNKNSNKYINQNKFQNILPARLESYDIKKFNETYFAIKKCFDTKKMTLLRYGVKVGEYSKNVFRYDLHYARSLDHKDMPAVNLNIDEVKSYLAGNPINKQSENKGYILLTYKNNPVDIAKTDGSLIKNHYPKGLRKNNLL